VILAWARQPSLHIPANNNIITFLLVSYFAKCPPIGQIVGNMLVILAWARQPSLHIPANNNVIQYIANLFPIGQLFC
jgi:hypothetical protein